MRVSKPPTLTLPLFSGAQAEVIPRFAAQSLHGHFSSFPCVDSAALRQQIETLKGQLQHLETAFSRYKKGEFPHPNNLSVMSSGRW